MACAQVELATSRLAVVTVMKAMHLVPQPAANMARGQDNFGDNAERDRCDKRSHVTRLPLPLSKQQGLHVECSSCGYVCALPARIGRSDRLSPS
jgi:hypothetical protein